MIWNSAVARNQPLARRHGSYRNRAQAIRRTVIATASDDCERARLYPGALREALSAPGYWPMIMGVAFPLLLLLADALR
jgi:hypothetical protein